jgi:hypothetical protein
MAKWAEQFNIKSDPRLVEQLKRAALGPVKVDLGQYQSEGTEVADWRVKASRAALDELLGDPVTHPPHYTSHPSGVECLTITRHMNFNLGNAIKYIWRADLKRDAIEDLRKAAFYIADEIKRREGND